MDFNLVCDPVSCLLRNYSVRLSLSNDLVQFLFKEKVFSKETADDVGKCDGKLVSYSLKEVCTTVAEDHNKFGLMINILFKSVETYSLAKEMYQEYGMTLILL